MNFNYFLTGKVQNFLGLNNEHPNWHICAIVFAKYQYRNDHHIFTDETRRRNNEFAFINHHNSRQLIIYCCDQIEVDLAKRDWQKSLPLWGKRAWQSLQGGWGKRDTTWGNPINSLPSDKRAWQNLQVGMLYDEIIYFGGPSQEGKNARGRNGKAPLTCDVCLSKLGYNAIVKFTSVENRPFIL